METKKCWMLGWLLALALVVAGLSGCGGDTSTEWKERSGEVLVTIVDDSLALVRNSRSKETCERKFLTGDVCEESATNSGLFLVNYHTKQKPLWGDTLDYLLTPVWGYYQDSVVMVYDGGVKFGFWKIGQKPGKLKTWSWSSPCRIGGYSTIQARPWKEGDILLKGAENCPYAILDTATGSVVQKLFRDDESWLAECDDISDINGKTACLQAIVENSRYGVILKLDNVIQDSLIWYNSSWQITKDLTGWYSNVFWINHPMQLFNGTENPLSGRILNKLDVSSWRFVSIEPQTWADDYGCFRDADSTICYSAEDLIVKGH